MLGKIRIDLVPAAKFFHFPRKKSQFFLFVHEGKRVTKGVIRKIPLLPAQEEVAMRCGCRICPKTHPLFLAQRTIAKRLVTRRKVVFSKRANTAVDNPCLFERSAQRMRRVCLAAAP